MHRSRRALFAGRLADERGRRIAFVSHCLLNENTRYLGGAFKAGALQRSPALQPCLPARLTQPALPCSRLREQLEP